MDRTSKLKSYSGRKIITFENFGNDDESTMANEVKKPFMKELIKEFEEKGITVQSAEDPTWESDGYIELSDTTHLIVEKDGSHKAGLELNKDKTIFTKSTTDLSETLIALAQLKEKWEVEEADYTVESVSPAPQSPFLMKQRASKVGKAARLVRIALEELKHAPKLDEMSDIPDLIEQLEKIVGEDTGLSNLAKLYEAETK